MIKQMITFHLPKPLNNFNKVLKNDKGLSLMEIVVSMAVMMILMVYGFVFFDTAWKYRAEGEDYFWVLNTAAGNMDALRAKGYADAVGTGDYILGNAVANAKSCIQALPSYSVTYSLTKNDVAGANLKSVTSKAVFGSNTVDLRSNVYKRWWDVNDLPDEP